MNRLSWILLPLTTGLWLLVAPLHAQGGQLDHLVCYDVNDKVKPDVTVDLRAELQPEFNQTDCRVLKVTKFCVPATKILLPPAPAGPDIGGQALQNDYVCYQLRCPKNVRIPDKLVVDQFGQRPQQKFKPFEVCAPARKGSPPCFRIGTSKKCGGVCPNDVAGGTKCRFDDTLQDCTCEPQLCGGKPDTTGHCGGVCPTPSEACLPGLDAAGKPACICKDPPPPECSLNSATGMCGGSCPDPAAACVFVTLATGPACICQPPVPQCGPVAGAQCGGPCPPGLTCVLNPAINACRCEPQLPCGPNPLTGQCGGLCPTGEVCRLVGTGAASCGCVMP